MSNESFKQLAAVYSPHSVEHNPPFELWRGLKDPHYDIPERATYFLNGLVSLRNEGLLDLVEPGDENCFDLPKVLSAVHNIEYIDYLKWLSSFLASEGEIAVAELDGINHQKAVVKRYPAFAFPSESPRSGIT